jgi:hypothetical protein
LGLTVLLWSCQSALYEEAKFEFDAFLIVEAWVAVEGTSIGGYVACRIQGSGTSYEPRSGQTYGRRKTPMRDLLRVFTRHTIRD